jgi:hypothetical protein
VWFELIGDYQEEKRMATDLLATSTLEEKIAASGARFIAVATRWWTVADVAAYRGVSPRTIYNWVKRAKELLARGREGGIPFSQPRGTKHLRFKPEAVRAFFGDKEDK